jgi:hypothetical protein
MTRRLVALFMVAAFLLTGQAGFCVCDLLHHMEPGAGHAHTVPDNEEHGACECQACPRCGTAIAVPVDVDVACPLRSVEFLQNETPVVFEFHPVSVFVPPRPA